MNMLIKFAVRFINIHYNVECKRFAGHSKWANIRHTKMEKDMEKSTAIQLILKKMKIAIAEGKSAKPEDNFKLARLIDQAKKNSLPQGAIKSFLEKMQRINLKTESAHFLSRGPSGCIILIHILSDNVARTRQTINTHLRKTQFLTSELPSDYLYEQKGIIYTELNNQDIDKAIEDAIEVGAEDAVILKEDNKEFLKFTCYASELPKVQDKLEEKKYTVIKSDVEFIPQVFVTLKDEEMDLVSKLYDRLSTIEEVVRIYNNIS